MGGCSSHPKSVLEPIYSKPIFDVYNVDHKLSEHSKGRIEITNDELILHYKNKGQVPIKWPLKGLRRYGFHRDIFLFECNIKILIIFSALIQYYLIKVVENVQQEKVFLRLNAQKPNV
jgi:hypothetical protein